MFLLAAMGPPGGGRMVISKRLQSRFNLINMTFPQVCSQSYSLVEFYAVQLAVAVYRVLGLLQILLPLQENQIKRIFGTMISQKLQDFDEDVKPLADVMTQATIEIYNFISTRMLPTPTKIHYLFNLRDISKVLSNLKVHSWIESRVL